MRTQFPKGLFLRYHTFWKRYNYGNGPDMGIKWVRSKEACIISDTKVKMKIALICLFVVVLFGQDWVNAQLAAEPAVLLSKDCSPLKWCGPNVGCQKCCGRYDCPRGQVCMYVILKFPFLKWGDSHLLLLCTWLQFSRNHRCVSLSPVDRCFPLKSCPKVGCKECCGNRDCPKGQVCRYVFFELPT